MRQLHSGGSLRPPLAMSADTKEVNRLAKLLKLKKRKNLPAAFKEDGLDCILSNCGCTPLLSLLLSSPLSLLPSLLPSSLHSPPSLVDKTQLSDYP